MRNLIVIIVLGCLVAISGCRSFQSCIDRFGSAYVDSVRIDTIVQVISRPPSDNLTFQLGIDSLLLRKPTDTLRFVSDAGIASAKIWKDRYNNIIQGTVECDPDTILQEVPIQVQLPCPEQLVFTPPEPNWYQELWEDYKNTTAFLLPILILGFILIDRLVK